MRRCSALLVSLAGVLLALGHASVARADDPRELFGFDKQPASEPIDCADGKSLGCASATDPLDPVSPYALRTWLPASYLLKLPVADGRHDGVAHYGVGASRDEAGPAFGGATGLENRWTIEGAPADSMRTGGVETRVPLTFMARMLVTAGGFAARDRTSTGGTIDVELVRGGASHAIEAHAWTGVTAEGRRRPVADASYFVKRLTVDAGHDASASVVATGPLPAVLGGTAWYAAGVAPAFQAVDFAWRAARLVDRDGDGLPDGFPGQIELEPVSTSAEQTIDYLVPVMARVGWERGAHAIDLTLIGHANRETFMLSQATLQAAGIDRTGYAGDGIATWRGSWKAVRARAQFAWHRSVRRDSAHDPAAAGQPQLLSAYIPASLDDEPALAQACSDAPPDDPYALIPNCPVPFGYFASGGAGQLSDLVADRPTMTADLAHRFGRHVARIGGTFEDARLVTTSRFTGDQQIRSLFPGHVDRTRFFAGSCPDIAIGDPETPCEYRPTHQLLYRTRHTAAYLEDTFEPVPGLRVNGGVRWELMWVGTRLHFSDELAPRLGFAWDVRNNGRIRLWASMGRSFLMIPAGTGHTVINRHRTVRDVETDFGHTRTTSSGAAYGVAPGIQPAAQDEVTGGIELGVAKLARIVVWAQGRMLRRGLETVIQNPETFEASFDNPGRNGDLPARRDASVIAAELMMAPSPKLTVRASYLHNRTVGSWTGPFDPRQGATLYNSTDWDFNSTNQHGLLPSSAGHRAFVELERRGRVGSIELAVATRLTASSGRPRSVLADTDEGLVYLIPRGTAGRGPVISQANVRLAARWQRTDLTLDVFNAFDRTAITNLDEIYAGQSVRPIAGGTTRDLVWLKTADRAPPRRRSAYRLPTAFQSPISVVLGLHQAF
ncbi:MAG: TonB-dependent receptor [Deltaproteobacteria bacterium]|nr:TonB-dependent receptor [Deltaproteobacteria bacterium]MDQ3299246.1 TonB-dependent receptor [Myxococcota bacterium]